MRTPNLPIRSEMENTGASTSESTMKQICASVISEGGYEPRALSRVVGTPTIDGVEISNTKNTWSNLVTIRLADINRIVVPAGADLINISNADFEYGLFLNATPETAFTFSNYTSAVQYSTQTLEFSNLGDRVAGGYLGGRTAPISLGGDAFNWDYQLGSTVSGVSDTLTLAVRASRNSADVAGLLKWFEL